MVTVRLDSIFSRYCSVAMRTRCDKGIPVFSETSFKRAMTAALKRTGMAEFRLTPNLYITTVEEFKKYRLTSWYLLAIHRIPMKRVGLTGFVFVRFSPQMKRRVLQLSRLARLPMAEIVRQAVDNQLPLWEKNGKPRPPKVDGRNRKPKT